MFKDKQVAEAHSALLRDPRAINYCISRGLSYDIISEFRLGWIPPEESFNTWRGRLVFPIKDALGRFVAWQGRLVIQTADNQPKYLHQETTPSWKKGDTLFGLEQAIKVMTPEKVLYLWEGPIDSCHCWALGMPAVSVLGSSMSAHQAMLCAAVSQNVIVASDTDAAGTKAALQYAGRLENFGVRPYRLLLQGKDLGDIVEQYGRSSAFKQLSEAERRCREDMGKRSMLERECVAQCHAVSLYDSL